jgi:hypothetical protein
MMYCRVVRKTQGVTMTELSSLLGFLTLVRSHRKLVLWRRTQRALRHLRASLSIAKGDGYGRKVATVVIRVSDEGPGVWKLEG